MNETGSAWVDGITQPAAGHDIFLLRVTLIELTSAVTRRRQGGLLTPAAAGRILSDFHYDFGAQYQIIEAVPLLIGSAAQLVERHALRAYDGLQLAAALQIDAQLRARGLPPATLVSADGELNAAARLEGLQVEDPNASP